MSINSENYFLLFANCIPVKGFKRSVICDIQKERMKFIPNLLFEVLTETKNYSLERLKIHFNNELNEGLDKYFNLLVETGWGFYTTTPENYPPLDLKWSHPGQISNAILDIDETTDYNVNDALTQLSEIGCNAVQLRFFKKISLNHLQSYLLTTHGTLITYVELILQYIEEFNEDNLIILFKQFYRMRFLIISNSPYEKEYTFKKGAENFTILYTKQKIDSKNHCGIIDKNYFALNVQSFTETSNYNSCLNKKVGIDTNGDIKNCPSLNIHYGNLKTSTLKDIISKKRFQQIWSVKKDQISVCKDCEFRMVCTDCRAYTVNENDPLAKPLKCTYNPYEGVWN